MIRVQNILNPMKKFISITFLSFASAAFAAPCETIEIAELNLMNKDELIVNYCKAGKLFLYNFKDAANTALSPGNQTRALTDASACDAAQAKISRMYSRKYDEKIHSSMCKE